MNRTPNELRVIYRLGVLALTALLMVSIGPELWKFGLFIFAPGTVREPRPPRKPPHTAPDE